MKLNELLENVEVLNILGDTEVEITGVNIDSRKIEKGHLFIAIPGTQTDGHKFIPLISCFSWLRVQRLSYPPP